MNGGTDGPTDGDAALPGNQLALKNFELRFAGGETLPGSGVVIVGTVVVPTG